MHIQGDKILISVRTFGAVVEWTTFLLMAMMLWRSRREGLFQPYPVFYAYVAYMMLYTLVLFPIYMFLPGSYSKAYWSLEFATVSFSLAVTWEIYRIVLRSCPGVYRLSGRVIAVLYTLILAKFAADVSTQGIGRLIPTMAELERDVRFMQAVLLFVVIALVLRYRIPMGRNAACLTFGYAFFIGAEMANLALRSALGMSFQRWWEILAPLEYLAMVGLWCVGLWVRSPSPAPSQALERDYARASRDSADGVARLRGWLGGALGR